MATATFARTMGNLHFSMYLMPQVTSTVIDNNVKKNSSSVTSAMQHRYYAQL
jgi:hypothetical protein